MQLPTPDTAPGPVCCQGINDILSQVGDKWTIRVVVALRRQPRRFNQLKRHVAGISQQMLTRTLRSLERDGMASRTVLPTKPPQVEYSLTALGVSLSDTVRHLADWAMAHRDQIRGHQQQFDNQS